MNKQHELIIAVNKHTLKNIKQSAKKTVFNVGGSTLKMPIGNLVLLQDHPNGQI